MSDPMRRTEPDGLSPLDRAIIAQLQTDGRTPFSAMAAQFGVSKSAIQRRVQQLMDEGYFTITGVVDPLQAGQGHAVLIGLGTEASEIHNVGTTVAAIPEARFVALVSGTFDVVCEVVTPDRAGLLDIITHTLSSIPGIRSVNTSWVLGTYKTNFLWDRESSEVVGRPSDDPYPILSPFGRAARLPDGFQLDELDAGIVRILQERGRTSYAELAAQLGTKESTARRRTLRLLESGYVQVVALGDPYRLGFQEVVLLWIKVELSHIHSVLAGLAQNPAVWYLTRVVGAADIVAGALFTDHTALARFLDGPVAALTGVREVAVSLELATYKRAYVRYA